MRPALVPFVSLLPMLGLSMVSPLAAQTDLTLEVGASQVGPQVDDEGESARFGVAGIRASHYSLTGSGISASFLFGHTIGESTGGDFFSASLASSMVEDWGGGWAGGMDLRLLGFGIRAPFPYRALAAEGGPILRYRTRSVSLTTAAVAGVGRSRIEVWRVSSGPSRVFTDDLWRIGGTTELLFGTQAVQAGIAGGVHETTGGTFASGGGRIVLVRGRAVVELRADLWRTPAGSTDLTGGLEFMVPLSGWSLRGFLGRSEPDPLTLAGPGSGSGGLLIGRSLYARLPSPPPPVGYEVVAETPRGAWVRMRVDAPTARRVELVGDFTVWEAIPMMRRGDRWEVELEVGAGAHHYGYLVDGEWYVPEDERSVVPDEWGRMSAILVIERE